MSFFVKATPAPEPRTKDVKTIATFYAAILTVMLVAQLFTFEGFIELLKNLEIPGGDMGAYLVGAVTVVVELLALPFLLHMTLSPALRWVSMVSSWLAALVWVKLTLWQMLTQPLADSVGFFGSVVTIMPGWWAVFVALALGVLAAWASWGMWPQRRHKK